MGIYDTIIVQCPNCGKPYNAQSKSGPCEMREYSLAEAPEDVLVDVNRHAPFECECGCVFEVGENRHVVATVMRPRKDHLGIEKLMESQFHGTKFRAWHSGLEEMIDHRMFAVSSVGQILVARYEGFPKWPVPTFEGFFLANLDEQNKITLMQFTGFKDKTGAEIFEGDFVLWPDTESEYVNVEVGEIKVAETQVRSFGRVVFRDGAFGVESNGGEAAPKGWYSLKDFLYDYCSPEDIEVIGNIYQNPELLQ